MRASIHAIVAALALCVGGQNVTDRAHRRRGQDAIGVDAAAAADQKLAGRSAPILSEACTLHAVGIMPNHSGSSATDSGDGWLCCPPGHDEASPSCKVLFGDIVRTLQDVDSNVEVTLHSAQEDIPTLRTAPTAASIPSIPSEQRSTFGDLQAVSPIFIERRSGGARRLQTSNGGARPIDYTFYHGKRRVLAIIIGEQVAGDGSKGTWENGCTVQSIQKLLWGSPSGVEYQVGASPWAHDAGCRTVDNACYYNARDHLHTISRGAVELDESQSDILYLSSVAGWPNDFCSWSNSFQAVQNAVSADGRYNWYNYQHRAVFLPRHCAIGQGSVPGTYTLNQYCPGSGVNEGYATILAHELGHNLGFRHAGTFDDQYADQSSVMGYTWYYRASTLSLAHRHMFSWLPDLPGSVPTFIGGTAISQQTLTLADALDVNRPAGSVWGAEIRDGDLSYFVSYRRCAGYDNRVSSRWCNVVQISSRVDGSTKSLHLARLRSAGDARSFGTNSIARVTLAQDAASSPPTVTVSISNGRPIASFCSDAENGLYNDVRPTQWCNGGGRKTDEAACESSYASVFDGLAASKFWRCRFTRTSTAEGVKTSCKLSSEPSDIIWCPRPRPTLCDALEGLTDLRKLPAPEWCDTDPSRRYDTDLCHAAYATTWSASSMAGEKWEKRHRCQLASNGRCELGPDDWIIPCVTLE